MLKRSEEMESSPFTASDREEFARLGIEEEKALFQLRLLQGPPPHLELVRACTVGDGIKAVPEEEKKGLIELYEEAASGGRSMKFVPASGAATRMFKALEWFRSEFPDMGWEELRARKGERKEFGEVLTFLENLERFAFFGDLEAALAQDGLDLRELLREGKIRTVLNYFLGPEGLKYGSLPKGLLKFHRYPEGCRTAFEEHLVEAAQYVRDSGGVCRLHFTVSPQHRDHFEGHFQEVREIYERRFGVRYQVTFSEQKRSTDTIAMDAEGRPFRLPDGKLLFRPGGHGALLENLNELEGDIVFIKNIDNVVPDRLKPPTLLWKKILGGYLLKVQSRAFSYLERLEDDLLGEEELDEVLGFLREEFSTVPPEDWGRLSLQRKRDYLMDRLHRPIRVCGVVPNQGEPGGGPFWVAGRDGTISVQIVESAQVAPTKEQQEIFLSATHFNPVDIVCGLRDHKGRRFDLSRYVDPEAVIITEKSKDGRPLKALELPGLWNGSMAYWNTVFVEVPLITFNPVKVVNDLLRPEHQP